jgi:putative spermidine/putrescine transport system permease protein/spermidine/putrescine transport system permease protein
MKIPVLVRCGLWLLAAITLILLYGPLLITAILSFFQRKGGKVDWENPTLQWYAKLFTNQDLQAALTNSVIVGLAATVCALVLGTVFATYYRNRRNWLRTTLQALIYLPFVLPPIITGLALLIFFRESGIARSLITVAIGHTLFVLALVYRIALTRLEALDTELTEASLDLGASGLQTFQYVTLPGIRSALIAAAILSFALSFDETLISLFLIGSENTVPIRLWGMMRVGFTPEVNAMVTLILIFSTTLFVIVARAVRRMA